MNLLRKILGMGYVDGDFWIAPRTKERVPLFPTLKRSDKLKAFELAELHKSMQAMDHIVSKAKCSYLEAKLWVLYKDKIKKYWINNRKEGDEEALP